MIVLAKLLVKETDPQNYTTYVFQCLDEEIAKDTKYIMCTRWPNWDHRRIEIGEVGYLSVTEIRAGIDQWYDGTKMIPYNYSNIQFNKFIEKKQPHKFVID